MFAWLTNFVLLLIAAAASASFACLRAAQLGPGASISQAQATTAQNSSVYPVEGIVVNSVTGEPIRNALVQIYLGSNRYSVLTGADGKFHFEHVPQSALRFNVTKPGFFSEQQLNGLAGVDPVEAGPNMPLVVLRLVPEGVIYGRITDAEGEPLENVTAKAFYAEIADGRRSFRQQFGVQTDGDGEFRIFELRPGTYYFAVGRENNTFYPGVPDVSSAAPIRVAPGQQIRVDLQVQPDVMYHISGMVVGTPPGANVNLNLFTANLGFASGRGFGVGRDGSFAQVMPAGRYVLRASAPTGDGELAASVPLDVSSNVTGLRLILGPTAKIPVKVDFALTRKANPGLPEGQPGVGVQLIPKDNAFTNREYRATLRLDIPPERRTFMTQNVEPGDYRVEIMPYGAWYVAAARRGGTDLLIQDLVVNSGGEGEPIEVTVRDDFASVRGTVSSDGQPVPGSVLLIPEREQQPAITIPVDAAGHFQMDSVSPGEYTAVAFDRTANLEYRSDEVMRPYASGAQVVRLLPGGEGSLNLQLQKRREY